MKLPRNLSGEKLARHLCRNWAYQQVNQVGSHIILQTDQPFVGNGKIEMSLKQTGVNGDPISVVQVKRILKDFSDYDAFL